MRRLELGASREEKLLAAVDRVNSAALSGVECSLVLRQLGPVSCRRLLAPHPSQR